MSATDELLVTGYPNSLRPELHKALKARGIDYWIAQGITFWNRDDGCECLAYGYKVNGVPKLAVKVVGFTDPAQAIEATLGPREQPPYDELIEALRRDWDIEASWDGLRRFWYVGLTDEGVRKRDEREATLGRGECHNASNVTDKHGQARFVCSACGAWLESRMLWNPEYPNGESPFVKDCRLNFCPNCGRKVVEE